MALIPSPMQSFLGKINFNYQMKTFLAIFSPTNVTVTLYTNLFHSVQKYNSEWLPSCSALMSNISLAAVSFSTVFIYRKANMLFCFRICNFFFFFNFSSDSFLNLLGDELYNSYVN